MDLLKDQAQISYQRPMPVDDVGQSQSIEISPSETVAFYYYDGTTGALTADAGQAAGVAIIAQFANKNILNAMGSCIATFNDTSLAYTSDALTSEIRFPFDKAEPYDETKPANKLTKITSGFTNGQFCIDYRSGTLYGVKATATTNMTAVTYKINKGLTGGTTSVTGDINIDEVGGTDVSTKNDAASEKPLLGGYEYEILGSLTADGGSAGDKVPFKGDANGVLYVKQTDGTNTPVINAAWAETLALANDNLSVGAGIYGMDADATTPIMRAVQVAVDNTTISATPNVTVIGGIYKNAFDTYDDNDAVPLHLNSAGSIHITASTDIPTTIAGGTKTVTTAGARVALAASTSCKSVYIKANAANTGNIYVGGITVDSTNGITLAANDSITFDITNLATVYIDSSVSLEGVGFTYFN